MIVLLPGTRGGGHQLYYEMVCGWGVGDLLRTFKVLCPVPCAECGSVVPCHKRKAARTYIGSVGPFSRSLFFFLIFFRVLHNERDHGSSRT